MSLSHRCSAEVVDFQLWQKISSICDSIPFSFSALELFNEIIHLDYMSSLFIISYITVNKQSLYRSIILSNIYKEH